MILLCATVPFWTDKHSLHLFAPNKLLGRKQTSWGGGSYESINGIMAWAVVVDSVDPVRVYPYNIISTYVMKQINMY